MPQAWPPSAPGGPTTPYDAYVETIGDEIMNDALDVRVVPRDLYYVERRLVADQAAEIVRLSAALVAAKAMADEVEAFLPPYVDWKEKGGGLLRIDVQRDNLRTVRAALAAFRAAGG